MIKFKDFLKWRALVASLLLSVVIGFLYAKGSTTNGVLIVLSLAVIFHIGLFYFLMFKHFNKNCP